MQAIFSALKRNLAITLALYRMSTVKLSIFKTIVKCYETVGGD